MKNILLAISLFLNLALFAQIPTNGLVGWYPFNASGADASGNSNNCTVYGATLTTDRFGNPNSAYSFNGISNYIASSFAPLTSPPYSISAWIKLDTTYYNQQAGVITLGDGASPHLNTCYFGTNGTPPPAKLGIGTTGANDITSTSAAISTTSWYHIVVVCNSYNSTQVTFYLNGVAYTQNTTNGTNNPVPFNNAAFSIGRVNTSDAPTYNYFRGVIDDVGIWDRALTQQEVTQIYNVAGGCLAYDTITVNDTITTHYSVYDTTHVTIHDTVTTHIYDTVLTNVYDTLTTPISVTDTLLINVSLTGINPPNNINTVTVYPNPAHDHLEINVGNLNSMTGYSIKITNALGQVVFNNPANQQSFYIDLNTWTGNGVYIIYILDATQTVKSVKEIVLQ